MRTPWERIRDFAKSHKVRARLVSKEQLLLLPPSPFNIDIAIVWNTKELLMHEECIHDPACLGGCIHELGHILASRRCPNESDEISFLGWEWQVAKLLKVSRQWHANMQDYVITSEGSAYRDCTKKRILKELRAAVEIGKKYGNIGPNGETLAVR
jgi:hypothetical protein